MKIGIMGTRGIPNQYGGFEQFTQTLSVGLVNKGHEVHVYNSSLHPYKKQEWNGVKIIHCKDKEDSYGTFGQFIYDLNCNKDAATRGFDVLFHFGYSSDSYWWRQWPRDTVNIMNMDGLEWKRTKYNLLTRRFLKWAESLAARKSDWLVADSHAMQDHIYKEYGKPAHFIPYCAEPFTGTDIQVLNRFNVNPHAYYLVIARMEKENNIEMIIRGYLQSARESPLLLVGDPGNRQGKRLKRKYDSPQVRFIGSLYDPFQLNNLRHFSELYIHGHSVGGTNPSLLEAMACSCNIMAHDNQFNRAVTGRDATYFDSEKNLAALLRSKLYLKNAETARNSNLQKIRETYNPQKIIAAYEGLAIKALERSETALRAG